MCEPSREWIQGFQSFTKIVKDICDFLFKYFKQSVGEKLSIDPTNIKFEKRKKSGCQDKLNPNGKCPFSSKRKEADNEFPTGLEKNGTDQGYIYYS